MLSPKFITTIKLHKMPAYQIAHEAGLHPSTLSKIINGIELVQFNDQRVIRIGAVLGMKPSECFVDDAKFEKEVKEISNG